MSQTNVSKAFGTRDSAQSGPMVYSLASYDRDRGQSDSKEQTLCERVTHTERPTAELTESMGYLS